jgi:hypothetical protein
MILKKNFLIVIATLALSANVGMTLGSFAAPEDEAVSRASGKQSKAYQAWSKSFSDLFWALPTRVVRAAVEAPLLYKTAVKLCASHEIAQAAYELLQKQTATCAATFKEAVANAASLDPSAATDLYSVANIAYSSCVSAIQNVTETGVEAVTSNDARLLLLAVAIAAAADLALNVYRGRGSNT